MISRYTIDMSNKRSQCKRCGSWFYADELKDHMDNCVSLEKTERKPDGTVTTTTYKGPGRGYPSNVNAIEQPQNNDNRLKYN